MYTVPPNFGGWNGVPRRIPLSIFLAKQEGRYCPLGNSSGCCTPGPPIYIPPFSQLPEVNSLHKIGVGFMCRGTAKVGMCVVCFLVGDLGRGRGGQGHDTLMMPFAARCSHPGLGGPRAMGWLPPLHCDCHRGKLMRLLGRELLL